MSKYSIGFCELYIPNYHDLVGNVRQYLCDDQKFLVVTQISTRTLYNMDTTSHNIKELLNYPAEEWGENISRHDFRAAAITDGFPYPYRALWRMRVTQQYYISQDNAIRDYIKIFNSKLCIYPQIIKITIAPTGESLCTIHTSFVAIIQRKWKRYFKLLMQKINKLKNPNNLLRRQLGAL
jgi:hypothetical protein